MEEVLTIKHKGGLPNSAGLLHTFFYMTRSTELVQLSAHCQRLADVLSEPSMQDGTDCSGKANARSPVDWLGAGRLLDLAARVSLIELKAPRCRCAPGSSSRGRALISPRSDLMAVFTKEVSVFNSIWSAFEIAVATIRSHPTSSDGMVAAACSFLRDWYEPDAPLRFYEDALSAFRTHLARQHRLLGFNEFEPTDSVSISGVGLYVVSKVRSHSTHGSRNSPLVGKFSISPAVGAETVELASRLVLFTIQHLAIAFLKRAQSRIACEMDEDGCLSDVEVDKFLTTLHMAEPHAAHVYSNANLADELTEVR